MEKDSNGKVESQHELTSDDYGHELLVGLHVPEVTWWKHPGLRKLYLMMPVLFLGSTINGYDGSLLNGLQTMEPWQACKSFLDHALSDRVPDSVSRLQQPIRTEARPLHCNSEYRRCLRAVFQQLCRRLLRPSRGRHHWLDRCLRRNYSARYMQSG